MWTFAQDSLISEIFQIRICLFPPYKKTHYRSILRDLYPKNSLKTPSLLQPEVNTLCVSDSFVVNSILLLSLIASNKASTSSSVIPVAWMQSHAIREKSGFEEIRPIVSLEFCCSSVSNSYFSLQITITLLSSKFNFEDTSFNLPFKFPTSYSSQRDSAEY